MNRAIRKWHYWVGAVSALPLLCVVITGLLLQFKKQLPWVQPPEQKAVTSAIPDLSMRQVLELARSEPRLAVQNWSDIKRIDIRPKSGIGKVLASNGWEGQIDLSAKRVVQVQYRRSDSIESLHDGSFFAGDVTKLGLFAPAGLGLLLLILSGIWLWVLPIIARKRKLARGAPKLGADKLER